MNLQKEGETKDKIRDIIISWKLKTNRVPSDILLD